MSYQRYVVEHIYRWTIPKVFDEEAEALENKKVNVQIDAVHINIEPVRATIA